MRETREFASLRRRRHDRRAGPCTSHASSSGMYGDRSSGLERGARPPAPVRPELRARRVRSSRSRRARSSILITPAGPGRAPVPRAAAAPAQPLPDWWNGSVDAARVRLLRLRRRRQRRSSPTVYRERRRRRSPSSPVRVLITLGTEVDPADLGPVAAERARRARGSRRAPSCRTRRRWSGTAARARRWWRWPPGCRSRSCRCSPTSPRTRIASPKPRRRPAARRHRGARRRGQRAARRPLLPRQRALRGERDRSHGPPSMRRSS